MRLYVIVATIIAVVAVFAVPASAANHSGFQLSGYHASPLMKQWAAESQMPLPPARVSVSFGGPAEYAPDPVGSPYEIYLPSCCSQGWTHHAIQGLLFHELGHVFDSVAMTPVLRAAFRRLVGVPAGWYWQKPIKTIRYVVSPDYIIKIAPSEMFAEEYAACSLGLTQFGYQDAGYNSYGWVPPIGTDGDLCALIQSAMT